MGELGEAAARKTILLVDDEALVRMGTAALLEELGHHVYQAASGLEALGVLDEHQDIEILLTDFRMPNMDGAQLILLAKEIRPDIGSVLMSGYSPSDDRFNGLNVPQLAKPFSINDLQAAIRRSC